MTEHGRHSGKNWLDGAGPRSVSELEVQAAKPAFLAAIADARHARERRAAKLRLARRALAAAAASIVLLVSSGFVVALLLVSQPVEATPFMGFQGLVVSSFDLRPVPGVEIYRLAAGNLAARAGQLVAATDAQGIFNIPADPDVKSESYDLRFDGRRIGTFQAGPGEQFVRGYDRLVVDVSLERTERSQTIALTPGQALQASAQLGVELAQAAGTGWQGTLVDDKQWPSVFLFGQVVGGIYELDGPPSKDLRLTALVSDDVLKYYGASVADLRVIAQSPRYQQAEAEKPMGQFELEWRSQFHRGWYVLGHLPAGYDFLDAQTPQITFSGAENSRPPGARISWQAEPGVPYAVLLAPQKTGEAVACWIDRLADGKRTLLPAVRIIGRQRVQPLVYDVYYHAPDGKKYTNEQWPSRPSREGYFMDGQEPRGYYHTKFYVPLESMFKRNEVAGFFSLRLMDFTIEDAVEYGPVKYEATEQPGEYDISFEQRPVGQMTRLLLTGDLQRLAAPPAWDLYCDNVEDSYGYSADICIQHSGSYNVRAILHEKSGNVIFVERSVMFPPAGTLGYQPWDPGDVLVMQGAVEKPLISASLRAVSINAVASPAAYGYTAGRLAGPALFFNPSAEFHNAPLKELRTHLYVRAAGGDAAPRADWLGMFLDAEICVARPSNNPEQPLTLDYRFLGQDGPLYTANAAGHGWIALHALNMADQGEPWNAVVAYLQLEHSSALSANVFRTLTGLDVHDLADQDAALAKLRAFRDGPYFGVRFAGPQLAELTWASKITGIELANAEGFMVYFNINDYNQLSAGQWEIYSGGDYPSRVELVTEDGRSFTEYFDYTGLGAAIPR